MKNQNRSFFVIFAAFVFFCLSAFSFAKDAQAQLSFELLGKIGAEANWEGVHVDDNAPSISDYYGDSKIDLAGGLELGVLLRFEMGFAVGLNFNWNMSSQQLDEVINREVSYTTGTGDKKHKYDFNIDTQQFGVKQREMTVQHPSIGVTFRYAFSELFEVGLWLNYGFGSIGIDFDRTNPHGEAPLSVFHTDHDKELAEIERLETFSWDLSTFEFGILAQVSWRIPSTTFSVLFGGHIFVDYSRVIEDDRSLIHESDLTTFGFTFNVGARYDIYLDAFGAARPY